MSYPQDMAPSLHLSTGRVGKLVIIGDKLKKVYRHVAENLRIFIHSMQSKFVSLLVLEPWRLP